ncbi:MAG: NFACT RNA binding domain-containing protein [Lachnospiraceae bacterium]|nr:NFACT RNA binding domain-containing protein [Lachnospiraceae bacterium]
MAFDGITTAAIRHELDACLTGGGISRIVQSEKDELLLTIKNNKVTYRLLMSASPSLPLIYLVPENRQAPLTAPNFCMLLRKHLQGGQILRITQPSLERVLCFEISHRNELGDICLKKLIIEIMGKHSNIIVTDERDVILDSIKRIPSSVSSVREVLPGRPYFIPGADLKKNPLEADAKSFIATIRESSYNIVKAIYMCYTGIAPIVAEEFVYEAGIEPRKGPADLNEGEIARLAEVFVRHMEDVARGEFAPNIIYRDGEPKEFGVFPLTIFGGNVENVASVSEMLRKFYSDREASTRIRQKSADLRHLVSTALDRTNKKFLIQEKQMADTEKKDKYRIYGELLNTYGYEAKEGDKELRAVNYYTGEPITIPLDPTLTPAMNAQKYFERYNKLKRTADALGTQIEETNDDREQLESCLMAIDLAESEQDLAEIRRELADYGFAQRKSSQKGRSREAKQKPLAYLSSDGYTMYVGRNNYQNEEVTFKIGNGNDWWFHAKGMPGSHVIIKGNGKGELPDRAYEEAAALAAWYSSGRKAPKVEIDYTQRKNLHKKNGGKPGFVTYHTNYSMMAVPDIAGLKRIE